MNFISIILILCITSKSFAEDRSVDINKLNVNGQGLGETSYYYVGSEDYPQIRNSNFLSKFQPGKSDILNFPMNQQSFWIKTTFVNSNSTIKAVYIWDETGPTDELKAYVDGILIGENDYSQSPTQRIIKVELPADSSTTIFIFKRHRSAQLQSWRYWTDLDKLTEEISQSERVLIWLLTTFFMSLFFNLMFFYSYREKIYLYYMGYIISIAAFTFGSWHVFGMVDVRFCVVAGSLLIAFTWLFSSEFLSIKTYFPSIKLVSYFISYTAIMGASLAWFFPFKISMLAIYLGTFNTILLSILSAIIYAKHRQTHVAIYLIGFGCFLATAAIQVLGWTGYFEINSFHLIEIGAGIENCIMLAALAFRVKISREDDARKINSHIDSIETLNKEIKNINQQLSKVFFPHQINKIQSGIDVENTMPIGDGDATVICFDVIDSSQLPEEVFAKCIEPFMSSCRSMMMIGYDPNSLQSNGYIIKEMGDGFLCSVGFPFKQIGKNQALSALQLAESIANEFNTVVARIGYHRPIYCSIGIAKGTVKSYFSKSGRVRDDLWGRGIVLATRYESMRKRIFSSLGRPKDDILVIQETVFDSLPDIVQKNFELLDLKSIGMEVRDDPDAAMLAFRINTGKKETKIA